MIDKKVIKFAGAKVKEVDRQYEANNNAELDNGVYHQDEEEAKDEESLQKQIEEGQALHKQSEWQKIERMMIDEAPAKQTNLNHLGNLVIEEAKVREIEAAGGFPAAYTRNSLVSEELNYATAYYYLLCTAKEY